MNKVVYCRINKKIAELLELVLEKYNIIGLDWNGGLNLGFIVEDKDVS